MYSHGAINPPIVLCERNILSRVEDEKVQISLFMPPRVNFAGLAVSSVSPLVISTSTPYNFASPIFRTPCDVVNGGAAVQYESHWIPQQMNRFWGWQAAVLMNDHFVYVCIFHSFHFPFLLFCLAEGRKVTTRLTSLSRCSCDDDTVLCWNSPVYYRELNCFGVECSNNSIMQSHGELNNPYYIFKYGEVYCCKTIFADTRFPKANLNRCLGHLEQNSWTRIQRFL